MEDWYSLFNIDQPSASVRNITFENIWAMDGPAMIAPILKGDVSGVSLIGATEQGFVGAVTEVMAGATSPLIEPAEAKATFKYSGGLLKSKQPIEFTADDPAISGRHFEWLFGDGTRDEGPKVRHSFPDTEGTLLDGSGRFRVLLHVTDNVAKWAQAWSSQPIVLSQPRRPQVISSLGLEATETDVFDRILHLPAAGGYTFTLLTSLEATMSIDGQVIHSAKARPQVCGAEGDSVQPMRLSAALAAGDHHIRIERKGGFENAQALPGHVSEKPLLIWEGPGVNRQRLPQSLYSSAWIDK